MNARRASLADLLPPEGDLAGHGGDAATRALRNALDGLGDLALAVGGVVCLLLLDVQVLGVLADDNHVDRLGGGQDGLHGPDVGVQVQLLPQRDDGRAVALDGGGGGADGAEQGSVALVLEHLDRLVREGRARLLEGLEAGLEVDELEL